MAMTDKTRYFEKKFNSVALRTELFSRRLRYGIAIVIWKWHATFSRLIKNRGRKLMHKCTWYLVKRI